MIEHFEKGYSPSALQHKYKLTYEQARELAEEFKQLKEERNALAMGSFPLMIEAAKKTDQLRKQLDIAIKSINSAAGYLACMDDLSELTGKCNEQMALEELNKAIEQIKELKK